MEKIIESRTNTEVQQESTPFLVMSGSHPVVVLPDASFLLFAEFSKDGFDLVIANPDGEFIVVEDYFSFNPPPNLMIGSGAVLSPDMVMAKLHLPFGEDVMFVGPANSAAVLEEIGTVRLVLGRVIVKRLNANGEVEEIRLKRGDKLYKGDEIETGGRAFFKAEMADGTRFSLGKNANAILTDFAYNESAKTGNFDAMVLRGGFHYKSGKLGTLFSDRSKKHSTISTPSAIIGIRGSEAEGVVANDGTFVLQHIDGFFSVSDVNGNPIGDLASPTDAVVVFADGTGQVMPLNQLPPQLANALDSYSQEQQQADVIERQTLEEEAGDQQDEAVDSSQESTAEDTQDGDGEGESEAADETSDEAVEEESEEDADEETEDEDEAEEEAEADEASEDTEGQTEADDGSGEAESEPDQAIAEDAAAESEDQGSEAEGSDGEVQEDAATEETAAAETDDDAPEEAAADSESQAGAEAGDPSSTGSDGDGSNQTDNAGSTSEDDGAEPVPDASDTFDQTVGTDSRSGPDSSDGLGQTADGSPDTDDEPAAPQGQQESTTGENNAGSDNVDSGADDSGQGVTLRQQRFGQDQTVDVTNAGTDDSINTGDGTGNTGEVSGNDAATGDGSEILDVPETELEEKAKPDIVQEELPPDNPPVANDDVIEVDVPGVIDVTDQVLANDVDNDPGQSVTLIDAQADSGGVQFDGDRLLYTPDEATLDRLAGGETATETFTYSVQSGDLTDTAQVTVVLVGTNFAPEAADDQAEAVEDSVIELNLLANDQDPDGDSLSVVSVEGADGSVSFDAAGNLSYQPPDDLASGEVRDDTFTYTVSDGQYTDTGVVTITVTGRNDPPVFNTEADPVVVSASDPVTIIPLSDIFADADLGDDLEIVELDTSGARGTITIGSIRYEPGDAWDFLAEGETGTDSFFIRVQDGEGSTGAGTYTITIVGENDAPLAAADSYLVEAATGLAATATIGVLSNDTDIDNGDLLSASVLSDTSHGTLALAEDGSFTYTPEQGFTGTDSFTYQATDSFGATSTATVTLQVVDNNEAPVVTGESAVVSSGATIEGNVLTNDIDPEGDPLGSSLLQGPANGSVTLDGSGYFTYTANDGFTGTDSFTYLATDSGGKSTEGVVTVTVLAENQPPVASPVSTQTLSPGELFQLDLTTLFSDPEGQPLDYTFSSNADFLVLNGTILEGEVSDSDIGSSFEVSVTASDGETSSSATFGLDVVPSNNAPVVDLPLGDLPAVELQTSSLDVSMTFSDPDGDPLSYFLESAPDFVTLDGTTLTANPALGDAGSYTVIVGATDGRETVTTLLEVNVDIANNAPEVVVGIPDTAAEVGGGLLLNLFSRFADADGDPLVYTVQGPSFVSVSGGVLSIAPASEADTGNYSITVTASDGQEAVSDTFNLSVVAPVNQPPVAVDDLFANSTATVTFTGDVLANDSDPDGDPLTVTLLSSPINDFDFTLNPDGTFSYEPAFGFTGADSFTYKISDGDAGTSTATVTLDVSASQVISLPDSYGVEQNSTLSILAADGVSANDNAGSPWEVTLDSGPENGSLVLNADGSFAYTPNAGFTGTDAFTYGYSDAGNQGTYTGTETLVGVTTVELTVGAANQQPTGGVSIAGTLTPGSTVTADISTLVDQDGLGTLSYQWYRGSVAISGATAVTYMLTGDDAYEDLSVSISWTDGSGYIESVSSPEYVIVPQYPEIAGVASYYLTDEDDYLVGSLGDDTLTLIGETNAHDQVDLGDGYDTLILDDLQSDSVVEVANVEVVSSSDSHDEHDRQSGNVVGIANVEVLVGSPGGYDEIEVFGEVSDPAGIFGGLGPEDYLSNYGRITITGDATLLAEDFWNGGYDRGYYQDGTWVGEVDYGYYDEAGHGEFHHDEGGFGGGLREQYSTGLPSQLLLSGGNLSLPTDYVDLNNASLLTLDDGSVLSLNDETGEFYNYGMVESLDTAGTDAVNVIEAHFFENNGFLRVEHDLQVNANTFWQEDYATIEISDDATLRLGDGTTLVLDNLYAPVDIRTSGPEGTGSISGTGTVTISIRNSLTLDGRAPMLDFSQGVFTVESYSVSGNQTTYDLTLRQELVLSADALNLPVTNDAGLTIGGSGLSSGTDASTIASLTQNGRLNIDPSLGLGVGNAHLQVVGNLDNKGLIELSNTGGSGGSVILETQAILTNDGAIRVMDDGGAAASVAIVASDIVNNGFILLNRDVEIEAPHIDNEPDGVIVLDDATATISTGANGSVTNDGIITGYGSLAIIGSTFTSTGKIRPEDIETGGDQNQLVIGTLGVGLAIDATGVILESTNIIALDVFNTSDFDTVSFANSPVTVMAGNVLRLSFQPGHDLVSGGSLDNVITFMSLTGDLPTVEHNLGSLFNVQLVNDGANFDINVTEGASLGFDNDVANSDWHDAGNWVGDALPGSADDVLIDSHAVTFGSTDSGTYTTTINSLTIKSGGSLELTPGSETLSLSSNSAVFQGGSLTLNGGDLVVNGFLSVAGDLTWNNSSITGTGSIDVMTGMSAFIGGTSTLDVALYLGGSSTIHGDESTGGQITGSGSIDLRDELTLVGNLALGVDIDNDGILQAVGDSGPATIMLTGSLTNSGVLQLDSLNSAVTLTVSNLDNSGMIRFQDSSGQAPGLVLDAALSGGGDLDVDADAALLAVNKTLDFSGSTIDIDAGKTLSVDAGSGTATVIIAENTRVRQVSEGDQATLAWVGEVDVKLDGDIVIPSGSVAFDSSAGQIDIMDVGNSGASLTVDSGAMLALTTGDTITLNDDNSSTEEFVNHGELTFSGTGNGVVVNASFVNFGDFEVHGGSATVHDINSNVDNHGTLTLMAVGNGGAGLSAPIDNYGELISAADGGTDSNHLPEFVENYGVLSVLHDLDIQSLDNEDNGLVDIATAQTLKVSDFDNNMGTVRGSGTLDAAYFDSWGILQPGSTSATGILTIVASASAELYDSSSVDIRLTGNNQSDVLAFQGTAVLKLDGQLRLDNQMSNLGAGTSFSIVTSVAGFTGSFHSVEGTDLYLSHGVVLDVTQGSNSIDLLATSVSITGTLAADALAGSSAADVIHGNAGDDEIDLMAGDPLSTGDIAYGGDGDDVFWIGGDLKRVDGGDGEDQVVIQEDVDFRGIDGYTMDNVEAIRLDESSAQTVELDSEAIRAAGTDGGLIILGDSSDKVILYGNFNQDYDNEVYTFRDGTPEVYRGFYEYSSSWVAVDEHVVVEIHQSDGSIDVYGGSGDDQLTGSVSTYSDDLNGEDGDDWLDGLGGSDYLNGGDGDDGLVYDSSDVTIDGDAGIDSLLVSGSIDLSGVNNIADIEVISMRDNGTSDALTVNTADLFNFVGDNSLEPLLNNGMENMIITGDEGDTVTLNGQLLEMNGQLSNGLTSDYTEMDYFDDGELYVRFTDSNGLDVYVHSDLLEPPPSG